MGISLNIYDYFKQGTYAIKVCTLNHKQLYSLFTNLIPIWYLTVMSDIETKVISSRRSLRSMGPNSAEFYAFFKLFKETQDQSYISEQMFSHHVAHISTSIPS